MSSVSLQNNIQMKRNYGIDALRIISMLMVVVHHILLHGGVLDSSERFSANYEISWLLQCLSYCAVNCYGLISGYVGVFAKHRYSSLILLWMRVVLYSFGIAVIFESFFGINMNYKGLLTMLFPVLTNKYWYFTAYYLLFLFIPFLNSAINNLSKRQLQFGLAMIVISISVVFLFFGNIFTDIWSLSGGFSPLWLIVLYLIGGYIRKYGILKKLKSFWFVISYFAFSIITWISMFLIQIITLHLFGEPKHEQMFISYLSITLLGSAVSLVLLFERFRFTKVLQYIIAFVSPLAFSVYLIHEHPLVVEKFINGRFEWIASLSPVAIPFVVIGVAICIFVICIAIDEIREIIFKLLEIKKRFCNIEDRITQKIKEKR